MLKRTFVSLFLVFAMLLTLAVSVVSAAPPAQEELVYTVKLGDNLWTLAEKYLGNGPAYSAIVDATNAKHGEDSSFAYIENPSLIHPGWKLLIPGVEGAVAAGKTFIFGRGGDSVQLDPAVVTDGESFRVTGQILEPLFQYEDGSTKPIPALATGYSVSDDGLVWTINLREGVKFHDGTPFNADAVVLNFERQWKTDHPLHFESQVYEYWEYMFNGFDDDCLITNIEAVDEYTVKISLKAPLAPMLANLAMDMFAISSPTALEKYGADYGQPTVGAVGTGPFKFVEWVEDDHITVEANADYWGGKPTIDKIIWRVIPDDSARYLALKAGDIHAMEQAGIEDIRDCEADANCYVEATGLNTAYLAFNYHIKEFQDPKVREAVFHAIDRQALKDAFYGNYGQVASTFLHPSMWGVPDIEDWTYDPELSKQLLAEAGFPDGLKEVTNLDTGEVGTLKFYYMPVTRFYYPSPKEIGEAMAADLAKVGIETELVLEGDWAAYLGARREGRLYGLYMLGWGGDNGDPDNFLNYFFGGLSGPGQVKEPDEREGWYANQQVADLLYQAATERDQAKRAPLYEQVEKLLHEDRARLWVMHNDTPRLFNAKVSGFQVQPVGADKYERVVIKD
jgi:peptide/nickel transport system substrate-binding protein